MKVLHNPVHLQYFKQFLEEHGADEPLGFWMAVEKLASETNSKAKSILVNNIVKTYFHGKIPAGRCLLMLHFTPFVMKASFP